MNLTESFGVAVEVATTATATTTAATSEATLVFGWLGVLGAWLCFGSFAVPMKWESVVDAQVHPLIYQGYKTFWTVITSHLTLIFCPFPSFLAIEYGFLSGLSWVPAGIGAIIAVQNVGIACGQAIWQTGIIMTSFVWGLFILKTDHFHDPWGTVASIVALLCGVVGMTLSFNLFKVNPDDDLEEVPMTLSQEGTPNVDPALLNPTSRSADNVGAPSTGAGDLAASIVSLGSGKGLTLKREDSKRSLSDVKFSAAAAIKNADGTTPFEASVPLGIGAAIFNGIWGGSNLVPSFYAPVHGVEFTLSFAYGAGIVNVMLLLLYWCVCKIHWKCDFPSFHFKVMALPGFVSGSLWSCGNFCSLYVVQVLGQGFGNSMIQSSVIVAGLWGILWYREVTGRPIVYWSLWLIVCVAGMLGLSTEKLLYVAPTAASAPLIWT